MKRTRSSQFEMMSEESNIAMPPEEIIEDRSLECQNREEIPTSATKELGNHPSKKVITELLENQ